MTADDTTPAQQDPAQRVMIFDTTLRDGEQAPASPSTRVRRSRSPSSSPASASM